MERIFKFVFLLSVASLANFVCCENVAVKIYPQNVVNVVSEKFISFSIDPAILMKEKEENTDDCMCMAISLSPAYVRIAGASTNDLKLRDFLQNKKPVLPHLHTEDSFKPKYLFKRSLRNNLRYKSFEELREELRNSGSHRPIKTLEELRESLKPKHEIDGARWPFMKLEGLHESATPLNELAEESNPPLNTLDISSKLKPIESFGARETFKQPLIPKQESLSARWPLKKFDGLRESVKPMEEFAEESRPQLAKVDLVPESPKPVENFGIDEIPPLRFEDFEESAIPKHEIVGGQWPFKKLENLHERIKPIGDGIHHPINKLDLLPNKPLLHNDLGLDKVPHLRFESLKEPFVSRNHVKHSVGIKNNLNKYIHWLRSANFTPVVALSYEDKIVGGSWNPTTALNILGIADKLRTGECVWQLGTACQGQTSEKYIKDLKTLRRVMDAYAAGKNGAWKIATSDIVQCLGNEPAEQLKAFLMSSSKVSDSVVIDSETTGQIFNGLSSEDKKNIRNELAVNGGTGLWKTVGHDVTKSETEEALNWLDALGESAQQGYSVVFKDLKEMTIFEPSMLYYVSLLHKKLVGQKVLNVQNIHSSNDISVYSHCACLPSGPLSGGVTVFAVNKGTEKSSISIKMTVDEPGSEIMQYVLASNQNGQYFVNGKEMKDESYMEPLVKQVRAFNTLTVTLPPKAVGFWVIVNANAENCRLDADVHNQADESSSHQHFDDVQVRRKRYASDEDDLLRFDDEALSVRNEDDLHKVKDDNDEILDFMGARALVDDDRTMKDQNKEITKAAENMEDDFNINNTDLLDDQNLTTAGVQATHKESDEEVEPFDIDDHRMELMMMRASSEGVADYQELFSLLGQLTSMLKLEKEFLDIGNAILKPIHKKNDTKIDEDKNKTEVKRVRRDLDDLTQFMDAEDPLKKLESQLLPEKPGEALIPESLLSKLKIPEHLKISLPKKGQCIQGLVQRAESIINNLDKNALADSVNAESRMAEPRLRLPLMMEPIAEKINLKTQLLRNRAKIDELKHKMKARLADIQMRLRSGLHNHNLLKRAIRLKNRNNVNDGANVLRTNPSLLQNAKIKYANKRNLLRRQMRKKNFVPFNGKMEQMKRSKRFITFDSKNDIDADNFLGSNEIASKPFGIKKNEDDKIKISNYEDKKDNEEKLDLVGKHLKEVVDELLKKGEDSTNKDEIDSSSNEVPKWNASFDLKDKNTSNENDEELKEKSICELSKIAQEKLTAQDITKKLGIPDDMVESVVKSVSNLYEKAKSKVGELWKTLGFN